MLLKPKLTKIKYVSQQGTKEKIAWVNFDMIESIEPSFGEYVRLIFSNSKYNVKKTDLNNFVKTQSL